MTDRFFASDNSATVHPRIMEAIGRANVGHAVGYGEDEITAHAVRAMQKTLGSDAMVFFVYSGTGANVIGLKALLQSHEAVVCSDGSHINYDECGAVENFTGSKLMTLPAEQGRITADQVRPLLALKGMVHHSQPRVVSITQATESGTVYPPEDVRALSELCREHDMLLHMDGARISNAAVHLGLGLREMTRDLGVDMVSLGGTKNGLMFGEAIVVWDESIAARLQFAQKQGMQLASKMRYIAAQFAELFGTDLWSENARRANSVARELASRLGKIPGVEIVYPVEANGVFARLPEGAIEPVRQEVFFYDWEASERLVRFMVSFDNTMEDVDHLERVLRRHVKPG